MEPSHKVELCLLVLKWSLLLSPISAFTITESSDVGTTVLVDKLVDMKNRAWYWLNSQRRADYGWGPDTSRVLLSIAAAVDNWPQESDLEARIIAKQLEVEVLGKLLRYSEEPITPSRLGYDALALNAICRDPRNYYGHNLIGLVEKPSDDYEYPGYPESYGFCFSSLVACLGGSHIHRRKIHYLLQLSREGTTLHPAETRAMALLALKCLQDHRPLELVQHGLHEGYEGLGMLQNEDGTFGNIHTTSLIVQGIGQAEEFAEYWNDTRWILGLAASQNVNGSFENSVISTADALLAISTLLNGAGILKFQRHECSAYTYTPLESIMAEVETVQGLNLSRPVTQPPIVIATTAEVSVATSSSPLVTAASPSIVVKYSLWIGSDPVTAEKHNLTMSASANISFFHLMQRAAELDPAFEFTSSVWPNGHYVHTISGHREQPVGYSYWLLYRLMTDPDPRNPPATTYVADKGVDDLTVADGDIFLFWFKKI